MKTQILNYSLKWKKRDSWRLSCIKNQCWVIRPFHFINQSYMWLSIFRFFFILTQNWQILNKNNKFLFVLIFGLLYTNMESLFPYRVCLTCYYWGVIIISFLFFFSILIKNLTFRGATLVAHLLPYESPLRLWDILYYLETIRNLIRPLTLRLRLTCNLITGHIILRLITNLNKILRSFILIFYFFENVISVVQRQVFVMLLKIYRKS